MVHDALCGQTHKTQKDWVMPKMNEWFNHTFTIAGIEVKIPVEGEWGPNWKDLVEI